MLNLYKDYLKISRFIHDGERVLDFVPIDQSSAALMLEKTLASEVKIVSDFSIDALKAFPNYYFDVISVSALATDAMTLDNLRDVLPELQRILMPSGRLLLIVSNKRASECAKITGMYLIPEPPFSGSGIPHTTLQIYMRNPLVGRGVPYCETSWIIPDDPAYNMNAFGRDYLNPWLVRGIVSGCGHVRLSNTAAMKIVRSEILSTYPNDSVDYGAALCGMIYAEETDETGKFLPLVEEYCAIANPIPHQIRWQISNAYALAVHAQKFGNIDIAVRWYEYVAEGDVCAFSATLGTKVMDALWQLALIALDKEDVDVALKRLRRSFVRADEILHSDWLNVAGDLNCPVPIAYDEIASVCQKAARAAGMVNVLARNPSKIELARLRARSNAERFIEVQDRLKKAQNEIKRLKEGK
jgi:SAM-dependent methyltransferase